MKTELFNDLISEYSHRYPAGPNLWSPLKSELEFWHRMRLFAALRWGLQQLPIPIAEARILDVGCGLGNSTRALLEFGVKPENVLGIDLLPSFISYAKSLNPAVPVRVVQDFDDWPREPFDLCIQCTAFSSIPGNERRTAVAQMMEKMVSDHGYIFWWDSLNANSFAGGDPLDPRALFENSAVLGYRRVSLRPSIDEALRYHGKKTALIARVIKKIAGFPTTHCAAVFRTGRLRGD